MYVFSADEGERSELLPVHLITAGLEHDQEPRHRPDGAPFHHVLFVEKGKGIFETAGESFALEEGTAVFIHKHAPINYYKKDLTFQTAWVTFDGPFVENLLNYFHIESFAFCKSTLTYSLIAQCFHLARQGAAPEQLSKALYELLITMFTELRDAGSSPHLAKAKKYIEAYYRSDISVEDMANAVGISGSLLYRLFHDEMHTTPVIYLQKIRIQNAKQLLIQHPEMKIAEIAACCGYPDCAYFCKVFKSRENLTPNAFRATYSL